MIDRQQLLTDLNRLLRELEDDLRARCDEVAQINADLTKEYEHARAANRTGVAFEEWRADLITQVAVAWLLSSIFVRFVEDNGLISPPRISGALHGAGDGKGLLRARDERDIYFRSHATQTDRDYLLAVFDDLAKLPGTKDVYGPHNPINAYRNWLSGDAAQKLIEFFQKIDADASGEIIHDFTDPNWDTRFLGDLYQDLSKTTRKKYALLQTPVFVEEFILARTLEPAIREFGLKDLKMIDPACGSGHFVLGGFAHILNHWRKIEPGTNERELVNRALASVHGVDLNPYAVAITRFRLLLAAMKECQVTHLKDAPSFQFNLACGDSLLHGSAGQKVLGFHELAHHYQSENIFELRRILVTGQYHAVVANPPYITVKDESLNQAYRDRYHEVCYKQYSLAVPFIKRLFDLACSAGFTGQITANSFMKREFGKKLIESYLPKVDLTHVVDTSGAYIPGHGTPTVILFGRNRSHIAPVIRAVMGTKGEPSTPADPAQGVVWTAITQQIDQPGSQSAFVSVSDTPLEQFGKHPWSIGGGGTAELKAMLDERPSSRLEHLVEQIGRTTVVGEDEIWIMDAPSTRRLRVAQRSIPLVIGEVVRNWSVVNPPLVIYPYKSLGGEAIEANEYTAAFYLWPFRRMLQTRTVFQKTLDDMGRPWWEHLEHYVGKLRTPLSIVFGFVATHNHFVLDGGRKVFNRSAPVIKLSAGATEDDHLALLGLLNSSTACFWMKQVFHNKGSTVDQHGARQRTMPFEDFWEHDGTKLKRFPVPADRPLALSRKLDALARQMSASLPEAAISRTVPTAALLAQHRLIFHTTLSRMITLQEDLDWECYRLYGLLPDKSDVSRCENPPTLKLGQRAFEIILARRMAVGEEESSWFIRHGSTPTTEIPAEWPEDYKQVVQRRIETIESDRNIGLIERPEYKRRWNTGPWEEQQVRALLLWLLNRMESYFDLDGRMNEQKAATAKGILHEPHLSSVAKIADLAKQDKDFMQVAELYAGRMDFDVANLVGDLIAAESVPCLPIMRYTPAGLDKRSAWERTWRLQRLEDAVDALFEVQRLRKIEPGKAEETLRPLVAVLRVEEHVKPQILGEVVSAAGIVAEAAKQKLDPSSLLSDAAKRAKHCAVGEIPVPPKYTGADFLSSCFWKLRGKLDVPKERWVSFPYCEGEDATLVIAWAGYDHLQLARAIAERYEQAKEQEGRKLVPLLAGIGQLIPWLKQWHNDLDPAYGACMGDYFESYLAEEAKALGMRVDQVMAWAPPSKVKGSGKRKVKA